MNTRERILAMLVVGAVLLVGGGFLFYELVLSPLHAKDAGIQRAQEEIEKKQKELRQAQAEYARLNRIKQLSLPGDANVAMREYERYLSSLFAKAGFEPRTIHIMPRAPDTKGPQLPSKKPIYTSLQFTVDSTGKLDNLVRVMESFYKTGLFHAIKTLTIDVPTVRDPEQQRADDLNIKMEIEALIVNGVDNRPYLLPNIDRRLAAIDAVTALRGGPSGLAWAAWSLGPTGPNGPGTLATRTRKYASIAGKNIFVGKQEERPEEIIDTTRHVFLTHIVLNDTAHEAYFNDRWRDRERKLTNQPGGNQIAVSNKSDDSFITVRSVQIDARDVIFKVGERYYSIHLGQNLAEAMREPLSQEQVDALIKERSAASTK